MHPMISACVTTFNEEANIDRCLESVRWCDEIVVVDSFSTDRTVELCRRFTDQVYQHEWLGYIGQKNLISGMARHPWILFIDGDEEVSPELRDEIQREMKKGPGALAGYRFPRKVLYLGQWIEHGEWYPDVKLRLFLKSKGHSAGREPHDQVIVDGPVKTLRAPLRHYTYDHIDDHLGTLVRFTGISARTKWADGRRTRITDITVRPLWRFLKGFFLKGGFLDGRRGWFIAWVSAFDVLVKYMKLWELELSGNPRPPFPAEGDSGRGPASGEGTDDPGKAVPVL